MAEAKEVKNKTAKVKSAKKAQKEAELIVESAPGKQKTEARSRKIEEETSDSATPLAKAGNGSTDATRLAKAGRRSAKAVKATEEKKAKAERQAQSSEVSTKEEKPKVQQKPARSKLERKGKKFRELAKLIEAGKSYSVAEAVNLAIKTSPTKFDATLELHVRLGVDPKQADQNIRDTVVLPAGSGKKVRIAVVAEADDTAKAKAAGADIAGVEDVLALLDKETLNFDILIATPSQMSKLGKYARLLGPKGLMPNPKSGTVTTNVVEGVKQAKAGRVEYRVDASGIIHVAAGKVSFGADKLQQNTEALLTSIKANKPLNVKGNYIKSLYLTTTMGPSIPTLVE